MAQKADVEVPAAPQSSVAKSCGPEDRPESAGAPAQHCIPGVNEIKTVQMLKEWPIITSTVNTAQQWYESLKTSSRLFNWSSTLAEKSVFALRERSTKVVATLYPAIRIADLAASHVVEAMQKKLPVVRQPPSQVSTAVKSGFSDFVAPLVDKIEFMVCNGRRRTRNAIKTVIEMYRKLVVTLNKWMEEVEKYIEDAKSKGVQAPQVQEQTVVTEPPQVLARTLTRRALRAAASAALFCVGATCWALARLPLIGGLLDPTPSPASSKSTSPVRQLESQSSHSSSESNIPTIAEVVETMEQQRRSLLVPESQSAEEAQPEK